MRIFKKLILLVFILIVGTVGYLGFSYTRLVNGAQKDLGVTYTMADYDRAVKEKAKIEVNNPSDLCLTCSFKTEGSQKVDLTLSNAETSAIQNFSNSTKGPIKNIQIKFSGKETEASFVTDFTYQGIEIKYPVYVKGNFWNTGSKSFYISVEKLEAGNLSIPGSLKKRAEREFMSYVNNILSGIDGLSVEKVEINNGSVNFVGDIPTKAYGF